MLKYDLALRRVPDVGPLQEQEVDVVDPQRGQLPREGAPHPAEAVVPRRDLRDDEDLAPRHPGLPAGPAHVQQVPAHLRGVHGPVPQLQRREDGLIINMCIYIYIYIEREI